MDWDNTTPIQCRNTPHEQQQWASELGLRASVFLEGTDTSIHLHPYKNIDVEELHLIPLGISDTPHHHIRIKPAWENDWWLPVGQASVPSVHARYRVELIGSTLQEGSPRHAARCWRLAAEVDFSSHVGGVELKARSV